MENSMPKSSIKTTVKRIERMEKIFDELTDGVNSSTKAIDKKLLKKLTDYYSSGKWLHDYEADEKGLLPTTLKRGVLSQDGIFNLLSDIRDSKDE